MTSTAKTDPKRDAEIAAEILRQLGGRRFQLMTGAKHLMSIPNGLSMKFPRAKCTGMHIRLENDLYNVSTFKGHGVKSYPDAQMDGFDACQLQELVSELTGLALSL